MAFVPYLRVYGNAFDKPAEQKTSVDSMENANIIWGGVIYREAMRFLPDYLTSIENQTDRDFKVLLINDNMTESEVNEAFAEHGELRDRATIIDRYYGMGLKPYELRVRLIEEAYAAQKGAHTLLIIGDCDDRFSENRVEAIRQACDGMHSLYYNELLSWEGEPVMPPLPAEMIDVSAIMECNFLGMSTIAIDLDYLDAQFIATLNEGRTFAFDWYLCSRIIAERGPAKLLPKASTYYRIHESNQAGLAKVTPEAIRKEIDVKIRHYALMYDTIDCVCAPADIQEKRNSLKDCYKSLLDIYEQLDPASEEVTGDPNKLMYWWDIIHKEEDNV